MVTKKPDDWHKPRTHGQRLTETDIASLKASYRAGKSSREAARAVQCSSRIASKYYGYFHAEGAVKGQPYNPSKDQPPSRFYRSNFEL